jgi:hypothetical protein
MSVHGSAGSSDDEIEQLDSDVDLVTNSDPETKMFLAKLADLTRDVEDLEAEFMTPVKHTLMIDEEEEEEEEEEDRRNGRPDGNQLDECNDPRQLLEQIDGFTTGNSLDLFDIDIIRPPMSPIGNPAIFGDQKDYVFRELEESDSKLDLPIVYEAVDPINSVTCLFDIPDPPSAHEPSFSESQFRVNEELNELDLGFDPETADVLALDEDVFELDLFLGRIKC